MKSVLKGKLVILSVGLFLSSLLFGYYFYNLKLKFYVSEINRDFYEKIDNGADIIDLSDLNKVDWNELVFVSPYTTLCEYEINGYEQHNENCVGSQDDGECWLALLKNNELVSLIPIDRSKIDLTTIQFPHRLSRSQA
jgi:hypothetical protein